MKQIFILLLLTFLLFSVTVAQQTNDDNSFTQSFMQEQCSFTSIGKNAYFILEPGFQLILQGIENQDTTRLVVTVLNETNTVGGIETRVVEENESVNDETIEISRNYFAICQQTGSVFYFGEEVDIYKDGKIKSHEGAWLAEGKNKAGIIMPGTILLGSKYYQEIAPDVAMDRAEIVSNSETIKTPAGTFNNCLKVEETTPLEPKAKEYKFHASGIGLVKDGELTLVKYGYVK
ncbi:MAG: hypothetical protein EPO24_15375 [Bacteroidetes bacterium]|nr:MAG: hypothetical protein EPO24_15375 [Bacteroidota bacterium]